MTPAEAAAIDYEEPDWQERFEAHCARWPQSSPCATEWGFESTLRDWRRWHATPVTVKGEVKKMPASSTDGIIALAKLGIVAPRWLLEEKLEQATLAAYQHDDHMWLQLGAEQWHIDRIEDRVLYLVKLFEPEITKAIDLNRADWSQHIINSVKILEGFNGKVEGTTAG